MSLFLDVPLGASVFHFECPLCSGLSPTYQKTSHMAPQYTHSNNVLGHWYIAKTSNQILKNYHPTGRMETNPWLWYVLYSLGLLILLKILYIYWPINPSPLHKCDKYSYLNTFVPKWLTAGKYTAFSIISLWRI